MIALAPIFLLAFAVAVAAAKGRYVAAAVALVAWAVLAFAADAAIGTAVAGDAPFADAWIVVLLQLAGWIPALFAACGAAAPGSWWARSGRSVQAAPLADVATNFVWVFAISLLGVLFAGVDILGAEIFCALFGALLASVLLFGFGGTRAQPA